MNRSEQSNNPPCALIVVLAIVLAVLLSFIYLSDAGLIDPLKHKVTDAIIDAAPVLDVTNRVTVIDIDEASLDQWGQWPWPREQIARLLSQLVDMGAGSIGLDFIMAEPDRTLPPATADRAAPGDSILAMVIASAPFVLGYEFEFNGKQGNGAGCPEHALDIVDIRTGAGTGTGVHIYRATGAVRNIPVLSQATPHAGFLNGIPDMDGRLRRLPLIIECDGGMFPNLAIATLLPTQSQRPLKIRQGIGTQGCLILDDLVVPMDANGNLRIRFAGKDAGVLHVSADRVLSGEVSDTVIRDRVVLVGLSAAGLTATYRTIGDDLVSAVDVHAQAVETMLSGNHIRRHMGIVCAEVLLALMVAGLYGYGIARLEFITTTLIGGAGVFILWVGTRLLFARHQILFSPLLPVTVIGSSGLFLMLFKYWSRQHRTGKRLQDALILIRNNERNLDAIIKSIPDIVFRLDTTGCISFVSPAITKYNRRPEELIGRSILDLVAERDRTRATYRINERRTGSRATSNLEIRLLLSPDGDGGCRGRYFSVSAEGIYERPDRDMPTFIGTQGIARDIDDRKHLERMLERSKKMEAIGGLAAGVAHDLNNILSGLVSYPELLLLDLPADSPMRGKIETIQRSGQRAADIVQDLLMIARRGVRDHMVINLNPVIGNYLKSPELKRLAETHPSIRIDTDLRADLMNIKGSTVHLQKLIMNLVGNAAEAMPAGGTIQIATSNRYLDMEIDRYERIGEGDYVILKVSDEGVGMSAGDLPRIFEPFYTKKQMGYSGSGLGMTVIWNTVKDHHGFIDIHTREGEGTQFEIYLPATREAAGSQTERVVLQDYTGSERILVVDDIAEQRDIAVRMLGKLGYQVQAVVSGEAAVAFLGDQAVDLVILDMVMPGGLDGLDTYRQILAIHPDQRAIVASGYASSDRVKAMQDLGAGEYIRKPYTMEKIGLAVRRELDRKKA